MKAIERKVTVNREGKLFVNSTVDLPVGDYNAVLVLEEQPIVTSTNGVSEGINTKIKLIKRQGYGFSNFENFRLRLSAAFDD